MDYPEHLHDAHNDYPLAPEKLTVTDDLLSSYAKSFGPRGQCCSKLIPNLRPKRKYVVHYRNPQLHMKLGLRLVKIHRIL